MNNWNIGLMRTCFACPQQYDAFLGDRQVGYLRLRHGRFTVEFPDCRGKLIYEAEPRGDGIFERDEEEHYLEMAKRAIIRELKESEDNE